MITLAFQPGPSGPSTPAPSPTHPPSPSVPGPSKFRPIAESLQGKAA